MMDTVYYIQVVVVTRLKKCSFIVIRAIVH